ncbi:MAG: ester cyclase [Candidatus Promineifilaceae bacterium]|nr:ester cyclase [Candidatus Promineifilaceae bacterium]
MTAEQNKAVVRRFFEAFGRADRDELRAILAPDLVAHSHGAPGTQSREEHIQGILGWNAAFETEFTIEAQLAEGDLVATRTTMRAVHDGGEFMGLPPSGKEVVIGGMTIERVKDGQIVERRVIADYLAMYQQLGLIPMPEQAR